MLKWLIEDQPDERHFRALEIAFVREDEPGILRRSNPAIAEHHFRILFARHSSGFATKTW